MALVCVLAAFLAALGIPFEEAVRRLCGVDDIAAVDEWTLERFQSMERHPVQINLLPRSRLLSSGLFSSYQVASIEDYRSRCGDILSSVELGVVDGFTPDVAQALSLFVGFDSGDMHPGGGGCRCSFEGTGGMSLKVADGKARGQYLGKALSGLRGRSWEAALSAALKSPWARPLAAPESAGWSVSFEGRRFKIIGGYYNARFAQGLAQWSGASFSSFATVGSLAKRPLGIIPYTSYATSYAKFGTAAQLDAGPFSISAWADFRSRGGGAHACWYHRHGEVGLTAAGEFIAGGGADTKAGGATFRGRGFSGNLAVDFQQSIGVVSMYGETTFRSHLLGVRFPLLGVDCGIRGSYINDVLNVTAAASCSPSNGRHCAGAACSLEKGLVKALASYSFAADSTWNFSARATGRLTSSSRKWDLRCDADFASGRWKASGRINGCHCRDFAILGYLEGGFGATFLQAGVFRVDNWDDRIYVYQRDTPGSFSIPAMYGRGYWVSVYSRLRPLEWSGRLRSRSRALSLYLRFNWTAYPWARPGDTHIRPSLSAKFQCVYDFGWSPSQK